jgi:hypothetical protein
LTCDKCGELTFDEDKKLVEEQRTEIKKHNPVMI